MTASRFVWIALLGSLLIVGMLVLSASGLVSGSLSMSRASPLTPPGPGARWGASSGPYNVTFVETGLPTGTFWSVSLHREWTWWSGSWPSVVGVMDLWSGLARNGSTNTTIGFAVSNGTFDYFIGEASNGSALYAPSPEQGTVAVNGTNETVSVTFSPVTLSALSFVETGLPSGTFWSVSLFGGGHGGFWGESLAGGGSRQYPGLRWNGSTGNTVNFTLPNGTYYFAIWLGWNASGSYLATPETGNVTVSGSAVTIDIVFTPITYYTVSFVETGLPSGTFWWVTLHGGDGGWGGFSWNGTTTNTTNFTLSDGVYNFTIGPAWCDSQSYTPTPAAGTVTVSGANVTVDVTFS